MMDEKQLLARVQFLSHKLFVADPDGKEFIQLMKLLHIMTPVFPQSVGIIDRHGGPIGWAAHQEGKLALLRSLEILARNYADRIEAENQKEQ
jgi:hypothetical protein